MSFSAEIKTELCKLQSLPPCCRKAQCYGMLLFARSFSDRAVSFVTEHPGFARLSASMLAEEAGVFVEMQTKITHRQKTPESCTVTVAGDDQRQQLPCRFSRFSRRCSSPGSWPK